MSGTVCYINVMSGAGAGAGAGAQDEEVHAFLDEHDESSCHVSLESHADTLSIRRCAINSGANYIV